MPEKLPTHEDLRQQIENAGLDSAIIASERPLILVDSTQQRLWQLASRAGDSVSFPVSTSRHGLGNRKDSFKTPTGIHRIAQKIGDGAPAGCVFKSRVASEEICLQQADAAADVITSRILWLQGLQPGLNQGGDVDSFERYIYIHGTADEAHIGQPQSIGCIRMKNADVIALYERVEEGDLVFIR